MDEKHQRRDLRVLLLEDNPQDVEIIVRELAHAGFQMEWSCVHTESTFLTALDHAPDLIISDFSMPQFDGMRALELLRTRNLDTPFILVSGSVGEDLAVAAIKNGADDYVLKDRLARLGSTVTTALRNKRLRNESRTAAAEQLLNEGRILRLAETQTAVLNALPAQIALLDQLGVICAVNEAWKRASNGEGLQGPDFGIGQNYLEVCERATGEAKDEALAVAAGIRQVLRRTAQEFCKEYPCHSPAERRWFRLTVTPLSESLLSGAVVMHVDITGRMLANEAIKSSEREQRLLAHQLETERSRLLEAQAVAKVGSWETDLETLDVIWSAETFRIFEITPEQFQPTHDRFLELVHPDDRGIVYAAFVNSIGQKGAFAIEHRILLADGRVKFIEERWRIFYDEEGRALRAVGTCQDITEPRNLQAQLLQSQKMEAVGRLAGGIAHDFNNLLTVILGYSSLGMEEVPVADPIWSMLRDIHQAGERAASLTRQLLAFSRKQVLSPQILDLNAAVSDIEKMLRRLIGEDITLNCILRSHCCQIKVDPGQLQQIIINLAVNARDAMPQGGTLTIVSSTVQLDQECLQRMEGKPGWYVLLEVTDTGCGMSPQTCSRVFEPFFTTKEPGKGTGLGLSTVFGIVKQSDGLIELESQEGEGTRFRIYFPAVTDPTTVSSRPDSATRGGIETILLVEDEDQIRKVAEHALRSQGYQLLLAANGQDALTLVASHPSPIHLVITDVIMPKMSGRVLAQRIRQDYPHLKVLFVSGYMDDSVVRHGVFEATDPFLQKPFTPQSLARKVREVLDA